MREILFRGKLASSGEWVYGSYVHCPNPVCIGSSHPYCMWVPAANPDETTTVIEVDPETIGQFTGLTDKNGARIFEGDIVSLRKCNELIYKVVYDNFRFELHNKNDTACYVLSIYKSKDFEIIGNIHDNPDILKGGGDNG